MSSVGTVRSTSPYPTTSAYPASRIFITPPVMNDFEFTVSLNDISDKTSKLPAAMGIVWCSSDDRRYCYWMFLVDYLRN